MKTEPTGLFRKYTITKADGSPVHPEFLGFVLRLDQHAEPNHRAACLAALATYADAIEPHIPDLARDLRVKYNLPCAAAQPPPIASVDQDAAAPETPAFGEDPKYRILEGNDVIQPGDEWKCDGTGCPKFKTLNPFHGSIVAEVNARRSPDLPRIYRRRL